MNLIYTQDNLCFDTLIELGKSLILIEDFYRDYLIQFLFVFRCACEKMEEDMDEELIEIDDIYKI